MDWSDLLKSIIIPIFTSITVFYFTNIWYFGRKEKKEEKIKVFRILMSTRDMNDYERVKALNSLEVVFYDAPEVLLCWKEYYKSLKLDHDEPTDDERKEISDNGIKLLESIAKHLGYKDKITWDIIKKPYFPKWLADHYQKLESEKVLLKRLPGIIQQNNNPNRANARKNK